MTGLLLLLVGFSVGFFARRVGRLPEQAPQALTLWIIWVSLPALIVRTLHHLQWSSALAVAAAVLWLVFALAAALAWLAVSRGFVSRPVAGTLALCCGLGNTAFVGLPLVELLYGAEGLGPAVFVDQAGSFAALSFLAVPFASAFGGASLSVTAMVRRVFGFPPFLALLFGLVVRPIGVAESLDVVLHRLGEMVVPLALAVVGFRFSLKGVATFWRALVMGLGYKLILAPAVMLLILSLLFGQLEMDSQVAVCQAAMAPMLTAAVLAGEFGFDSKLASALVGVGVPVSLVTVSAWSFLFRQF